MDVEALYSIAPSPMVKSVGGGGRGGSPSRLASQENRLVCAVLHTPPQQNRAKALHLKSCLFSLSYTKRRSGR